MNGIEDVDHFYRVLARDLAAGMEEGSESDVPYVCPWHGLNRMPANPYTGRIFRGANSAILWRAMQARGTTSPFWASDKAWSKLNGTLREGAVPVEIAIPVIDDTQVKPWTPGMGPLGGDPLDPSGCALLGFKKGEVYHQDDVEGATLPVLGELSTFTIHDSAQKMVDAYCLAQGPALVHGGDIACYLPKYDRIQMPKPESFYGEHGSDRYYGVLLHECIHSTGSKSRCQRLPGTGGNAQLSYAAEELVAEIGAAFLASRIGLATSPRADHLPYLKSWRSRLTGPRGGVMLRQSFRLASEASDFIWKIYAHSAGLPM